jgi:hypothetical protein
MITRVSRIVGLGSSDAHSVEERALLEELANEAVLDVLRRTRLAMRCVDITLVAGEREYELADEILTLHNLKTAAGTELNEYATGDIRRVGSGGYAVVGYNRLVLGWEPDADGLTISAWYQRRPTPMSDDTHDPSNITYGGIPEEFHPALINYMCWHAAASVGESATGLGERYRILYEGQDGMGMMGSNLGQIKMAINRRARSGAGARRLPAAGEIRLIDTDPTYFNG